MVQPITINTLTQFIDERNKLGKTEQGLLFLLERLCCVSVEQAREIPDEIQRVKEFCTKWADVFSGSLPQVVAELYRWKKVLEEVRYP